MILTDYGSRYSNVAGFHLFLVIFARFSEESLRKGLQLLPRSGSFRAREKFK
jgi:hypothetical protein